MAAFITTYAGMCLAMAGAVDIAEPHGVALIVAGAMMGAFGRQVLDLWRHPS